MLHSLLLIGFGVAISVIFGMLFMLAGGWLHHRGVLAGKGINDNFIGEAKGEVFRIPLPEDVEIKDEPIADVNVQRILSRVSAFKERIAK